MVTLCKPRIALMVVITAGIGFAMAVQHSAQPQAWTWLQLIGSMVGTAASCMAASVFNQAWERRTDALMPRTARRPMPMGRVSMIEAIGLGTALAMLGQGLLCVAGTHMSSMLAAVTIGLYVLVYTPMKRWTPWALWVGAVPGAMPPLIGYSAYANKVGLSAWLVFAIMFIWQVPHFLAIAWLYRNDYAKAGMKMLPVIDPTGKRTMAEALLTAALLIPIGLLPTWLGLAGRGYYVVALLAGVAFTSYAARWAARKDRDGARKLFLASLVYLPMVLTAWMALG
jgi:protoheme IX farnesyltransferase